MVVDAVMWRTSWKVWYSCVEGCLVKCWRIYKRVKLGVWISECLFICRKLVFFILAVALWFNKWNVKYSCMCLCVQDNESPLCSLVVGMLTWIITFEGRCMTQRSRVLNELYYCMWECVWLCYLGNINPKKMVTHMYTDWMRTLPYLHSKGDDKKWAGVKYHNL